VRSASKHPPSAAQWNPLDIEFLQAALRYLEGFKALPKTKWVSALRNGSLRKKLEQIWETDIDKAESLLSAWLQSETDSRLLSILSETLSQKMGDSALNRDYFKIVADRVWEKTRELEIKALSKQVRLAERLAEEGELMKLLSRLEELRNSGEKNPEAT